MEIEVVGLGKLRGATSTFDPDALAFKGIRYARAERWQPPSEVAQDANGTIDATEFGPRCMQRTSDSAGEGNLASSIFGEMTMSEDCLFLNVYTRRDAVDTSWNGKLPVMVFIHGGSYSVGESNEFDGSFLAAGDAARQPVVVVDFNYRLNVFGFAAATFDDGSSISNMGLLDQQMALRWVQKYIGGFGGDPERVTIFGQSSGANSILSHIVIESSFGLYSRVIIQSGVFSPGAFTLTAARDRMDRVLTSSEECTSMRCLEELEATALSEAATRAFDNSDDIFLMWSPVVDGALLTDTPIELIRAGNFNKEAQIIIGSNRDDSSYFMLDIFGDERARSAYGDESLAVDISDFGESEFEAVVSADDANFNGYHKHRPLTDDQMEVLKEIYAIGAQGENRTGAYQYPVDRGDYPDWWWMAMRAETDRIAGLGHCSVRHLARLLSGRGSSVYVYLLMYPVQSPIFEFITGSGPGSVLVPHGAEVPYEFAAIPFLVDPGAKRLAGDISAMWTQFAVTGDPNSGGPGAARAWPIFTEEGDETLLLDAPADLGGVGGVRVQRGTRASACDFWEDIYEDTLRSAPPPDSSALVPPPSSSELSTASSSGPGALAIVILALVASVVTVVLVVGLIVWRRRNRFARLRRLALVDKDVNYGSRNFELPERSPAQDAV